MEFQKALDAYGHFIETYADSELIDEVYFRVGFISLFKMKDFTRAQGNFNKIKDKTPQVEKLILIAGKLADKEDVAYNEKRFLQALFGEVSLPRNSALQIESAPSRTFIDEKIAVRSISLSPDTGCLVPEGVFLWSGDLGAMKITTNTPEFSTSFKQHGLQAINLVEEISGGILGYDATLITAHEVHIEVDSSAQQDSGVGFKARVTPPLPESLLKYSWKITRANEVVFESGKKEFSYHFFKPGEYNAECTLSFLEEKIYSDSATFTIQ